MTTPATERPIVRANLTEYVDQLLFVTAGKMHRRLDVTGIELDRNVVLEGDQISGGHVSPHPGSNGRWRDEQPRPRRTCPSPHRNSPARGCAADYPAQTRTA